jgi:D-alanyl-D-alanine carboxypeptidase/D-alanyl-D-alanine-endopeptidase (penicillin-binding protein 4)
MRAIGLAIGFFVGVSAYAREEATKVLSPGELQRELSAHIGQPKFAAAQWGVKVVSLDSGAVLFETNAHKLLKPASNAKIFTGALALDIIKPEGRIRTSILVKEGPDGNGRLAGDLIVYGRGDPTFSARFQNGNYSNLLGRVVEAIRAAGIREIAGDVVGDETFFSGPRLGSGWAWDDLQYYYGAEVSSLSVQDNVVDLTITPGLKAGEPCRIGVKPETSYLEFINRTRTTGTNVPAAISVMRLPGERRVHVTGTLPLRYGTYVDAVTVPDPAQWFVEMLSESLAKERVVVRGKARTRSWPDDAKLDVAAYKEVGFTESTPMREIVPNMLKPSQNLYAQLLFLQAGARSATAANSTEDAGIKAMRAFVKRAGIDPGEVLLEEGSGLSRSSLVTPDALVSILKYMAGHPQAGVFREALPGPGEGTLRNRFRDWREGAPRSNAGGNKKIELRAKTGSLRYVSSLSGYLRRGDGENLAFALILNAYEGTTSARDEVEAMARVLARGVWQ